MNKKKKDLPKSVVAIVCSVICAVTVAVIFIMAKSASEKQKTMQDYIFDTSGFESVLSVTCLNETMAVYTDLHTGKVGIMSLSGEITEEAQHTKITVCSDSWRNYRYIVETPLSEYILLADAETKTVTSRQYHGITEPEKIPCWSEVGKHLAWTDAKGYRGEIEKGDLGLSYGLYPVATSLESDAKWGYVSNVLRLDIATLYDGAMDFSEDLAAVCQSGKWGYIRTSGVTAIPFEFDSCAYADTMGRNCAFSFRNGLAPACKNGKYGIINSKGETVVEFVFDSILQGENGKYIAMKGGTWGVITISERLVTANATTTTTLPVNNTPAIAKGDYLVNTSGSVLNLRAATDVNSDIVAKIPNGSRLTVTKAVSGWAYVQYNSYYGWVSSDFLVPAPASTAQAQ